MNTKDLMEAVGAAVTRGSRRHGRSRRPLTSEMMERPGELFLKVRDHLNSMPRKSLLELVQAERRILELIDPGYAWPTQEMQYFKTDKQVVALLELLDVLENEEDLSSVLAYLPEFFRRVLPEGTGKRLDLRVLGAMIRNHRADRTMFEKMPEDFFGQGLHTPLFVDKNDPMIIHLAEAIMAGSHLHAHFDHRGLPEDAGALEIIVAVAHLLHLISMPVGIAIKAITSWFTPREIDAYLARYGPLTFDGCEGNCAPGTFKRMTDFEDNTVQGCCLDRRCYEPEELYEYARTFGFLPHNRRPFTVADAKAHCGSKDPRQSFPSKFASSLSSMTNALRRARPTRRRAVALADA